MHPEYTIYLNSYKEKLDAFSREYKKDGVRCLPRILAENEWGGKEKVALGISRNECWLKEVDGVEFIEWRVLAQGREGGTMRMFGVQGQKRCQLRSSTKLLKCLTNHDSTGNCARRMQKL